MDFNALQHKLFAMDPVDPREDIARMKAQAQAAAPAAASENIDYITESVDVPQGTLEMDRDYSVTDFAALAGVTVNESQKTGSAGQCTDASCKARAYYTSIKRQTSRRMR